MWRSPSTCRPRRRRCRGSRGRATRKPTRSRSWAPAASCLAPSRSRPSMSCSTGATRRSGWCRPTVGMPHGPSTARGRGPGIRRAISAASSATSPTTGGDTRCLPSRSPRPTRCSSCSWRRPMRRSPTPADPRRASTGRGLASWWARSSAATLPTSCSWACGCQRRGRISRPRWAAAASRRPTSRASSRPTKRRCSSDTPHS